MTEGSTKFKWYWLLEWQALLVVALVALSAVWLLDVDADLELLLSISIWVLYGIISLCAAVLLRRWLGSARLEPPLWFKWLWCPLLYFGVMLAIYILLKRT